MDVARPPSDRGPNQEAGTDGQLAAESVGDVAADRAEEGVDKFEFAQHKTPVRLRCQCSGMLAMTDTFMEAIICRSR